MNLANEIKNVEKQIEAVKKKITVEEDFLEKHSKLKKTAEAKLKDLTKILESLQVSKLAEIGKAAGLSFEEIETLIQKNRKKEKKPDDTQSKNNEE